MQAFRGLADRELKRDENLNWYLRQTATFTRDTLDNFKSASRTYAEVSDMSEQEDALYFTSVQMLKGQSHNEMLIVDCGEFRILFVM